MNTYLRGKEVVIVGGGSGIGASVAKMSCEAGANVTLLGIDPEQLARTSEWIGGCQTFVLDVNERASVEAGLAGVEHIDHLVVTAGRRIVGRISDVDPDQLFSAVEERVRGVLYLIRFALPKLAADASITLTSGVLAERPSAAGTAVLSAAVAGVEALGRAFALELAPRRVNVVSPGVTSTGLLNSLGDDQKQRFWRETAAQLPLKRIATVEEVASTFLHLMSNTYLSGEVIHVDGGARLS